MKAALIAVILLTTSASALVPRSPADEAVARTDAIIAQLALAKSPQAALAAGMSFMNIHASPAATREVPLAEALFHLYAASGVRVDAALVNERAALVPAAQARDIARVVEATAVAAEASKGILSSDDYALLTADLRASMMRITFQRDEAPILAALARADLVSAAPAALALAASIPSPEPFFPADGCAWVLDLPFVQVGGPCNDTYSALNFVQLDYGGDDSYLNNAGGAFPGSAISIDYGSGDDTYRFLTGAQGAAVAGVGILYDEGGSDLYNASQFAQGFAAAGFALLYDAGTGNDIYESGNAQSTIGTKAGGLGGVGVLVDEGGDDYYQQDGLDGFVYGAAGVGLLLEYGNGADRYETRDVHVVLLDIDDLGTFAGPIQVSAEVNGVAILYEEGGNDWYSCGSHVRQGCQGTGGVGAEALLLDLAGNDVYALGESMSPPIYGFALDAIGEPVTGLKPQLAVFGTGQGVGYGEGSAPPGAGVGILRDLAGNDVYIASAYAQGYSTGGLGLLLDEGGADVYAGLAAPLVGTRADGQTWADGLALGVGIDRP